MLLLLFSRQPPPPSPELINFNTVLADLYPLLNAAGPNDLVHWTVGEIYGWFDETAQRLARTSGVFVVRDTSIAVVETQGQYNLPASQVSTIQVDLAGVVLRPATVQELEALDSQWPAAVGPPSPSRFLQDVAGVTAIALYPAPGTADNAETLGIVMHATEPTISATYPWLSAPSVLQDYFRIRALGEARAKESRGAMQEVASWCRQVQGLYEQVIERYWGEGQ